MEIPRHDKKKSAESGVTRRRLRARRRRAARGKFRAHHGQLIRAATDEHVWAKKLRSRTHRHESLRDPARTRPGHRGELKAAISRKEKTQLELPPRSISRLTKSTPRPGRSSTPAAIPGDVQGATPLGARGSPKFPTRGSGSAPPTAWLTIARSSARPRRRPRRATPFKPPSARTRAPGVILGLAPTTRWSRADFERALWKASGRADFLPTTPTSTVRLSASTPARTAHPKPWPRHGRRCAQPAQCVARPQLGPPVDLAGAYAAAGRFCGSTRIAAGSLSWPVCSPRFHSGTAVVRRLGRLARDDSAVEPY